MESIYALLLCSDQPKAPGPRTPSYYENTKVDQHSEPIKEHSNVLTLKVEDLASSYLLCKRHAILNQEQWIEGTHRLLLPVSKITLKRWGGLPKPMGP